MQQQEQQEQPLSLLPPQAALLHWLLPSSTLQWSQKTAGCSHLDLAGVDGWATLSSTYTAAAALRWAFNRGTGWHTRTPEGLLLRLPDKPFDRLSLRICAGSNCAQQAAGSCQPLIVQWGVPLAVTSVPAGVW